MRVELHGLWVASVLLVACTPVAPEEMVEVRDSGTRDAGATKDAGPRVDAGAITDAGASLDGGNTDAGIDAGTILPDYVLDGGYATFALRGWSVHLAEPLTTTQRSLGAEVVAHLSGDLQLIASAVPPSALATLQQVPIWLEVAQPEFPGGAYHPSAQWLSDHGYPTAWARSIMLGNAANYLQWTQTQPAMVLHELAHAWHDQQLGFGDPDVIAAYQSALDGGVYVNVAYAGGGSMRAYALTNEREYFAELSESWFWRNDFAPFVRADLVTFDPRGAALMQAKWPTP